MKLPLKRILLFLFIVSANNGMAKVRWEPLKTPHKVEQIIGGASLNDYWVLDNKNTILHYAGGMWEAYPLSNLFSIKQFRNYLPILTGKDHLFVFLTDMDWKTHIAEVKNGRIIRYAYVTETPLAEITNVMGSVYATGNFGVILKLTKNHWVNLSSPIHSHIQTTVADNKGILWIGTDNEGVWSWNGKEFHQYKKPVEITKVSITEMKIVHDTLYINNSKNVPYKLINEVFYSVNPQQTPFNSTIKLMGNGYYKVVSQHNKVRLIPYLYKIKSFKELQDGNALLLTQNNQLFYDHHVNGNFFLDFTSILGLEGSKYFLPSFYRVQGTAINSLYSILQPGIIFSDFNKDLYEDILLFNVSDERHPFLYLNNRNNYFDNLAGLVGLNKFTFNGYFSYVFDLNGDNIPEIISPDFRNSNYYLNILKKTAGKYQLSASIPMPEKYAVKPLQYLSFTDIDRDGDLDMALVFGYSTSDKGSIIFLKNNGYGNFSTSDTSMISLLKGWNKQTIFADFNNDGLDDIFILRNWGPDVVVFRDKLLRWTLHRIKTSKNFRLQQRKSSAVAFDFDNDGDLDIFILAEQPFIRLLQNDGKGKFTDITKQSGLNILNRGKKSGHITAGDFDNNGFIDLFIAVYIAKEWKNFIFLNDSAHGFVDQSKNMGISNGQAEFVAAGDIDNDGDLDLYGFRQGNNILWLNNLDSSNYLRLRLTGIKSNSAALGVKIWLYEAGHLDDPGYLSGYRQTGSKLTVNNYQNERIVHFGVKSNKRYDVQIAFPAGKTRILKNIPAGGLINIAEITQPVSWFYTLDNRAYILLRNKEFLSYFAIIALGLLFLMFTIKYGTKQFRWDVRLTTIIVSLNIIIFGILLVALHSDRILLKYYLPFAVILLGSFGPIGFFLWIKRFSNLKTQKENNDALFQALLNFSHGSWALSNLNSLQLFFENLSIDDLGSIDYRATFEKRKETFLTMTQPVIGQIISLAKTIGDNGAIAEEIERYTNFIEQYLKSDIHSVDAVNKEKFTIAVRKLRDLLSKLKKIVFADYSCNPYRVIEGLRTELEAFSETENGEFKLMNFIDKNDTVLVEQLVLVDILDNCIQNARKAMSESDNKKLIIKLLDGDTRVFIEVTDNGRGIPEGQFRQIFENGYSTTHSSGYGLYHAREMLSKYGGRIYVKMSIPNQRTTMLIELQKGIKK